MKKAKKLVSLMLTLIMVFAMAIPTFAANTTEHTIFVENDMEGHEYVAYQVFKGDITGGKLTNIEWGDGVDGPAVLNTLKTDASESNPYKNCTSAEDVAKVLEGFLNDSEQIDAFAKVVNTHLKTAAGTQIKQSENNGKTGYAIPVIGDGYYLVKDNKPVNGYDAATKIILEVVEDVTVHPKSDKPDVDKVIVNADASNGKGTAQDVGTDVEFKLTSNVPKMDGYDTYKFIFHDTLSNGLTLKKDTIQVKVGETVLSKDGDSPAYTVEVDGQSFTVTINDLTDYTPGTAVEVTYKATINSEALNTNVETNTVYLEYSNDPNTDGTGTTTEKKVYVYDFDIVIDKYADGNQNSKLAGAKFVLKNSAGKFYKVDETTKVVTWVDDQNQATVVTTDDKGAAKFTGLDSGVYTLVETEAPDGYNKLADTTVTITAEYREDGQITISSATSSNNGQYSQTQSIENKSGAELPSTGGMGTTIFYVLGSILVLAAVVLLVTKKRMGEKN